MCCSAFSSHCQVDQGKLMFLRNKGKWVPLRGLYALHGTYVFTSGIRKDKVKTVKDKGVKTRFKPRLCRVQCAWPLGHGTPHLPMAGGIWTLGGSRHRVNCLCLRTSDDVHISDNNNPASLLSPWGLMSRSIFGKHGGGENLLALVPQEGQ